MVEKVNLKLAIYLPDDLLEQVEAECRRLDRSKSWLIQQAWRIARPFMQRYPDRPDLQLAASRGERASATGSTAPAPAEAGEHSPQHRPEPLPPEPLPARRPAKPRRSRLRKR